MLMLKYTVSDKYVVRFNKCDSITLMHTLMYIQRYDSMYDISIYNSIHGNTIKV